MRHVRHSRPLITRVALGFGLIGLAACAPTENEQAAETGQAIQPLPIATPQSGAVVASQGGAVSQNLAQAQITVVYNRPVARGREVFGHLVDFGDVWHPGADQATYIRTTADVLFGGELLPAGTYSIWAVPNPEEWEFILHRDWNVFHLPFPGEDGVQLRVKVTPQSADHMESMAFYFPVADRRSGVLAFHWAETKLEIPIEAPGPETN
jgi:hypothetical protein